MTPSAGVNTFFFKIYLFIDLWLCWVFVSARGPSPVAASGGHSSSRCAGLSLSRPLLLRSTGSRRAGSAIVAHGTSCSAACEIFPDQGSNPWPLHWQADSQPLRHQGSPVLTLFNEELDMAMLVRCQKRDFGAQEAGCSARENKAFVIPPSVAWMGRRVSRAECVHMYV